MSALQAVQRQLDMPTSSCSQVADESERGIAVTGLELWRGDYCVCNDLSLSVHDGQLVHLRGANGAGKTSLIRVLAGLALPESGEIRLDGNPIVRDMNGWRGALCYVGHSDGVKRELTPYENLRLAARLLAGRAGVDVSAALERVSMAAHAGRLCGELSAGQRRRTALARLLVAGARIWLLDEPLVSLDHSGTLLLETLLREHLRSGGMVVVATHQPINLSGLDVVAVDLPRRTADPC